VTTETTEPDYLPSLTMREAQVLRMMSDGYTNKEIGKVVFLTENTIKAHQRGMFKKLGARNRTHAVAIAHQLGLIGHDRWRIERRERGSGWWACVHKDARQEYGVTKVYEQAAATCLRLNTAYPDGIPPTAPSAW
jgi:DNA-binding CsgD family transcriptional regulator